MIFVEISGKSSPPHFRVSQHVNEAKTEKQNQQSETEAETDRFLVSVLKHPDAAMPEDSPDFFVK